MDTNKNRSLVQELISQLCNLNQESDSTDLVRYIMLTAYEIKVTNTFISTEDNHLIADLVESRLLDPLDLLEDCLFELGENFDVDCGSEILEIRSGVQLLLSNDRFQSQNFLETSESLEDFDKKLKVRKSFSIATNTSLTTSVSDFIRNSKIPSSHDWWSNNLEATSESSKKFDEIAQKQVFIVNSNKSRSSRSRTDFKNKSDNPVRRSSSNISIQSRG